VPSADLAALEQRLVRDPKLARKAQLVVGAAQEADLAALKALVAHGADLNASWRNYRPLHALIQEKPHAPDSAGRVDERRLAALDWLLSTATIPSSSAPGPACGPSSPRVERSATCGSSPP